MQLGGDAERNEVDTDEGVSLRIGAAFAILPVEHPGEYQALGAVDLQVLAEVFNTVAVVAAQNDAVVTVLAQVDLDGFDAKSAGAKPLADRLGAGPCVEYTLGLKTTSRITSAAVRIEVIGRAFISSISVTPGI